MPNTNHAKRSKKPMQKRQNGCKDNSKFAKDIDREREERTERFQRPRHNDTAWYAANERALKDIASFPFGKPTGALLDRRYLSNLTLNYSDDHYRLPGTWAFDIVPTIASPSQDVASAFNVAARDVFTYVRHMNSGAANYAAPDLMMYIAGVYEIAIQLEEAKRAYGITMYYNAKNINFARTSLAAAGFDENDLMNNLAQWRVRINQYGQQLERWCVPTNMPILSRWKFLLTQYFKDSMSDKGQNYIFRTFGMRHLTETSSTGTAAKFTKWSNPRTLDKWTQMMDTAIEALVNSDSFAIMSGDISKAYGDSAVLQFEPIDAGYTVAPVFVKEALWQIQNLETVFVSDSNINYDYSQIPDTNSIRMEWQNQFTSSSNSYLFPANKVLTFDEPDAGPAQVIEGVTLCNVPRKITAVGAFSTVEYGEIGSEIVVDSNIYYMNNNGAVTHVQLMTYTPQRVGKLLALAEQFDYHPALRVASMNNDTFTVGAEAVDIDNYVTISVDDIENLHRNSIFTELGIYRS